MGRVLAKGLCPPGHSKPDFQETGEQLGEENCPSREGSALAVPTPCADLQAFTSGLSTRS